MDKLQQLYKLMINNGLLTNDITLERFRGADESQQQKLYNLALNSKVITADKVAPADFKSIFSESAQASADFKRELVQAKGDVVDLIKQEKQRQFIESIPRDEAVVDAGGMVYVPEIPEQKIPVSPLPQKPVSQQIDELVAETSYKSPEKIAIEEREKTIREAEKEARRAEGFYDDKGFVEQFYGKELLSKTGIDVQEFTDFLIDEGLLNEMQDKMDRGLYERTFGESVNPDLTYDMDRFDAIRAYLSQKHSNELRDVYTEKQKNNRGYADYSLSEDEVPKIGADVKELMSYVETNLPIYSQKIQEQEEKNKELYDQYKEDGIGSAYRIKTGIKKAYEGFDDALSSLSIGFYDLVGDLTGSEYFNNVSKSLIESERQEFSFEPYDLTYGFASGKEVFQDGIEYMVGDRGQVYDVAKNLNVTNLITPKEYASITSKANQTDRTTWSFSGTGTAANLANVMGDIGVQILYQASLRGAGKVGGAFAKTTSPGRATVNALKRIPIKRGLSEAIIAQSTLGYSRGLRDVYIEAKKSGLSDKEATELASLGAKQMGLLYALTAPIAQRTNITDRLLGEPSKKAIKDAVKEYSRTGNKGFVDVFLNLARNYKEYGAQGFKELLQENVQQAGERFVVNPNVNREARQRILEDTITFDEFINTSILSFLAGGLLPAGIDVTSDTYNLFKDGSVSKLEALAYLNGNQEKTERLLNSQVAKGVYTQTQVDKILKDMDNYRVSIGKMPRKTSPQAASSLLSDLTELSELELDKQSTDPVFHSEIDEKISNIRGRVQATIEFDQLSPESKLIFTEQATKNLEATKDQETNWEITSDETFDESRKLYYETKKLYQDVEVGVDEATQSLTDEGVSEPTQEQIAARQKELTRKKIDDAIQEQEARDIPDVEPAEGVQEVEEEVRVTPEEEVEEESIKDSQIPKSKTIYTTKRDDGETFTVEVTTRLDGSRTFVYKSKDGTYLTETASPDNTLTDQEYISRAADIGSITETKGVALENVMNPKMRERLSARQRAELGIDEEVTPQLYKLPETKKEWVKDFDIIDNRGGKADLEILEDGKTGRWYVENNKTGKLAPTKTKAEAQAEINNPTYDYGEGDPIITTTEKVETKTDEQVVSPQMTQEQINQLSPEELTTRSNQLEAKINKIFKGKYEATVGGRRVGRKISPEANDRIKIIQDNIVSENIQDKNQSIIEAIDELQSKTDLSQSDIEQIVNLETALAYNEASEMDEQNPSRLFNLMNVEMNLSSIIEEGKTQRAAQVAEDVERRRQIISKGFEDITGMPYTDVSGIESEADRKAVMDQKIKNNAILAAKAREREATNKFVSSIRTFIAKNEDLDGLVDIVSKSTGDFLGGSLQEIISDRLFDSSIEYKRRNLELKETLSNKLQELFGKNFSKTLRKFSKETENLQIADDVTIPISQNKLMYLYNQYKDEANHPGFESQFGSNYAEIMERAEQMLDPRLKEFADYQVDELFPQLYSDYNEVYRKIYRTNLPWNRKYAGRLYRVGDPFENLDLLASPQSYKASIAGASTKARVKNKRPIEITDGMDMLYSYLNDMEFFRAYAESMKDVNRLMGNPDIKLAIEATSGPDLYRLLTQKIQTIANRGAVKGDRVKFVNLMNDAFVLSRLGVNPTVALKQLTSTTAYAADIGVRNWTSYAAKAMPEIASVMKEITDNSVYLKDRYSLNIKNVLEAYNTGDVGRTSPINGVGWADILMYFIKQGDRGAIILGGAPNYLYHKDQYKAKNPKATEEEVIKYAIRKFERETDKAQQSSDIASKDLFQTAGDLTRAFNLFLTTPKQYQRKVNSSIRQIYRKTKGMPSKGTFKDNLRNLFVYHVWLPVVFQYATLGLPGILSGFDEEDKEDLIRAAILGNINAFFVVGGLVSSLADYIQGKPWAGRVQSLPVINVTQNLLDYGNKALTSKKQDTRNRFTEKFLTELAMTGGIPAGTLLKLGRNWSDVITGKTDGAGESILKLLGYSDYVVTGGKKNKETDKKLSQLPEYKELKKTNPELYNKLVTEPKRVELKGSLDSQLKAQEKAMNDLLGIIEEEK